MFTLKQCGNKIRKMAYLEKLYPEKLVDILSTGLVAAVTKPEGGKRG